MPERSWRGEAGSEHRARPADAVAGSDPRGAVALLALQRTAGNAAVGRLLRKPLITSDYNDLASLRKEIDIVNVPATTRTVLDPETRQPQEVYSPGHVTVSHPKGGLSGFNTLSEDFPGETAIKAAKQGGWGDKISLGLQHPSVAWHKGALEAAEKLSYVAKNTSGSAIGKVSDQMLLHVPAAQRKGKTRTEGVRNMLLHVFGQAIITTLYGRGAADVIGDIHERDQGSLITGAIRKAEVTRAIDNYADMINNVYGQQLGRRLAWRLWVGGRTTWTPERTAEYVNAVQEWIAGEFSWTMSTSFTPTDEVVVKFTNLLNEVTGHETPAPAPTPAPTPAPAP